MSVKLLQKLLHAGLLMVVAGLYVWMWISSKQEPTTVVSGNEYQTIEISSLKSDAEKILSSLDNVSGIPLGLPLDKMGRENPFSGL